MNTIQKMFILSAVVLLVSCGESKKQQAGSLDAKKAKLEELKKKATSLNSEIKTLEEEIALLDTTANNNRFKLVSTAPVTVTDFSHYIDLQGKIDAEDISYIAPSNGMGGVVTELYIREGQSIQKGQKVLKLDDKVLRQQLQQLETQLAFAKDIYQRTKNLWDQQIGSEVQLISAKNNVDALEKQMATLQEQIKLFTVVAPVSGIADIVNIKVGELFTGASIAGPQIRVVNNSRLKVVVEVPENYMSRVRTGSSVVVFLPDLNQTFNSSIRLASQTINPNTRTFTIEADIPGGTVRPNSVAAVRIKDYNAPNALVIPVNLLQTDDKGKYVYVAEKDSKGRTVAVKKPVVAGESYSDQIEIRSGLQAGMQLITAGYQNVYNNQVVQVEAQP